ncbi:MAG: ABC transporter ATP-binding protein [Verrucomicrobia bacterium]|nr:ABC transporter ATP-binding protein [Deltaproteobacteria bacterium]
MSHHIVEVRNLRHVYSDGTAALKDVSFIITHGESVGIIGANGAGKSTLLLHLNGCLSATGGEIRIGDTPLTARTLPDIRRTVGMVFQYPDDQLFMPTVFDDVAFGPCNLGLSGLDVEQRVMAALSRVGAGHLREKPPYNLSGGEKKRVAIATVLSMSPDILVMDEPTSGLDPFARRQLIGLIKDFRHTRIIASHDLDMVYDVCERTIILNCGIVAADGPTRDVFRNGDLLKECRLEKPLSRQVCPECEKPPARDLSLG